MTDRYDFVFSLGAACSCTQSLRAAGLQFASFPLDWVSGSNLSARAELVAGGFAGWLDEQDFDFVENPGAFGHDTYRNRKTGFLHPHDFDKGVPISESMPAVREKYDRRVSRLVSMLESSRRVLAVWIADPREPSAPAEEEIRKAISVLSGRFRSTEFRMLALGCEHGVPAQEAKRITGAGYDMFSFDYASKSPDAKPWDVEGEGIRALLSGFACADYRTAGEKKAQRARDRARECERFNAHSTLSLFVNKLEFKLWKHLKKRLERRGMALDAPIRRGTK